MIEVIIPTYKNSDNLDIIINSFLVQTSSSWKLHIVVDGNEWMYKEFKSYYRYPNIRFSLIDGPNNDWGHTPREYGLLEAEEEWIIMTGDDNYYVPSFIQEFTKAAEDNPKSNFIYCDMLHNQYDYQHFVTTPQINQIDIGCFMTKRELAQQIPVEKSYAADGLFVEEYKKNSIFIPHKINKILYVHN